MIVKVFRLVWYFSLLAVSGILLYTYAGLPQDVTFLNLQGIAGTLSRDIYFYIVIGVLVLANVLPLIMIRGGFKSDFFKAWVYGLIVACNIFFCMGLGFVSIFNSTESYDFSRIAVTIYGSVALVALWSFVWPLYRIFMRLSTRS